MLAWLGSAVPSFYTLAPESGGIVDKLSTDGTALSLPSSALESGGIVTSANICFVYML